MVWFGGLYFYLIQFFMHAYLFLIIQFFMHARSRKPYVYFRSIFVARAWFGIPPVLFLKNRQTGSYHRTSRALEL